MKMNKALGRHMLLELYDCPLEILNNIQQIEDILVNVVDRVNATLISKSFHQFSPYGVSGVVVIAESHITIHTWPEHKYAAIDVFTCDDSVDYNLVESILVDQFKALKHSSKTIPRGEMQLAE